MPLVLSADTMASRRERALYRTISPRLPARSYASMCTHSSDVTRGVTRKRIYAPNRLPLCDPRADARGELIWAARRRSRKRVCDWHYSTFRLVMLHDCSLKRGSKRGGEESSTKRTSFTVPGPESRRRGDDYKDAVGMFSQQKRSPVTFIVHGGGGIHLSPAIGVSSR